MKKFFTFVMIMMCLMAANVFAASTNSLKMWLNDLPNGRMYGMQIPYIYLDVAAASATAFDSCSISTTTLVAGATTLTLAAGDFTDIITPRNITAVVNFAVGAATSNVVGTLTVTGVNALGDAATETFNVSTNSVTGNVAYRTITSAVWTITSVTGRVDTDNALLNLGSGVKIGLPCDILGTDDVKKCIENAAVKTSYTLNTTYNTITFETAPNATNDYQVWINNR